MNLLLLVLLHIIGALGGLLLRKLKLPAGALVGAMLAVMSINSFTPVFPAYPHELRVLVQIASGLVIGTRFSRSDVQSLKTMALPVIVLVTVLLATNLVFAFLMEHSTSLSFMTSFFACAPGGVSDLALVASDFGAVMEHVALLQLFRLTLVIIVFPPMIRSMLKIKQPGEALQQAENRRENRKNRMLHYIPTFLCALSGGLLFYLLNIPAGAILGAIIAVAILNIAKQSAAYPASVKVLVQIFAGTYIGSKITAQTFLEIDILFAPALILTVELFVMAFLTAYILHKACKMDWATALFSSTPGGIQEMGLISDELGLQTPKIVLMHTFRILAVLGVLPVLAGLFG
ncbi:MAG: AbrB family transcriptional regulator [Sphaerochaeta sp.]|jgi:membrane AbrB-like protein|uniref:AbrB family transcriptional regulator n=1 Tax=unclassified Sphaerochaeta TaxID=2637943 RepID=UPI000EC9BA8D|nr:AbrB family transcriptional regulator [Sphaerochaeta sp. UBA5836]MEA4866192.1 AbrB family transcriptional regulator [Sphaerochaeta sp.]HAP57164.1 ammonia monooxygenase [Sphaerochaeta sp.]